MAFRGKRIAETLTPREDLARVTREYNSFMMTNKDTFQEWDAIRQALERQYGKRFALLDLALAEQARRPKFKTFVKKLDELGEKIRELTRLCRLSEAAPDSSESWTWMFKDSIAPKDGRPGHKFHIPGKIKHFQEGPAVKAQERPRRGSIIKM